MLLNTYSNLGTYTEDSTVNEMLFRKQGIYQIERDRLLKTGKYAAGKTILVLFMVMICFLFTGRVNAEIKLLGEMTRHYQVEAGNDYQGKLRISNTGDDTGYVRIYQKDYRFEAGGNSYYLKPDSLNRSNAEWIELKSSEVTEVPPRRQVEIYYDISVPSSVNKKGTYWSVIMVEPLGHELFKINKGLLNLKQSSRLAVQIITDINNSGKVSVDINDPQIITEAESNFFQIDIKNTGEKWLTPEVWLELYTSNGKKLEKFKGSNKRIFPGTSVRHQIQLTGLAPGEYLAILLIDNGASGVFGRQYQFLIE